MCPSPSTTPRRRASSSASSTTRSRPRRRSSRSTRSATRASSPPTSSADTNLWSSPEASSRARRRPQIRPSRRPRARRARPPRGARRLPHRRRPDGAAFAWWAFLANEDEQIAKQLEWQTERCRRIEQRTRAFDDVTAVTDAERAARRRDSTGSSRSAFGAGVDRTRLSGRDENEDPSLHPSLAGTRDTDTIVRDVPRPGWAAAPRRASVRPRDGGEVRVSRSARVRKSRGAFVGRRGDFVADDDERSRRLLEGSHRPTRVRGCEVGGVRWRSGEVTVVERDARRRFEFPRNRWFDQAWERAGPSRVDGSNGTPRCARAERARDGGVRRRGERAEGEFQSRGRA